MISERKKENRINIKELDRAVDFIHRFYKFKPEVYLSGSHNPLSSKFPQDDSDVDIYLTAQVNGREPIIEDIELSQYMRMALGHKYQVFIFSDEYKDLIIDGMTRIDKGGE